MAAKGSGSDDKAKRSRGKNARLSASRTNDSAPEESVTAPFKGRGSHGATPKAQEKPQEPVPSGIRIRKLAKNALGPQFLYSFAIRAADGHRHVIQVIHHDDDAGARKLAERAFSGISYGAYGYWGYGYIAYGYYGAYGYR